MRRAALALALCLLPAAAAAQEDKDRITRFLQDSLSGAGRVVQIDGFRGALSSRATMQRMTFADAQGVWLTVEDAVLDWNRLAVLRGDISINELAAARIVVARAPVAEPSALPAPEAPGFALPELPVSVNIGRIQAGEIVLEAALLGQPVTARLQASAMLAGGEGRTSLVLDRTDGVAGRIALEASYANSSTQLDLSLQAAEAAGGLAATLLGLPGEPAAELTVAGSGPVTGFAADLRLATDGTERVAGRVTLRGAGDGGTVFAADLGGDIAPLLLPDHAAFFGPEVRLQARGVQEPGGRLRLDALDLRARSVRLQGRVVLGADGLPEAFDVTGRLADPDGVPVLLPVSASDPTRVQSADLALAYDAQAGEGWKAAVTVVALDRADLRIAGLALRGSGRITRAAGGNAPAAVGGVLGFAAEGLAPADAGLAAALGPRLQGEATAFWQRGTGVLRIARLALTAADFGATVSGTVGGLGGGLALEGRLTGQAEDLSRFALLAGRPLAGRGDVTLAGRGSPLGGDFDITGQVAGTDLAVGVAEVDNLLRGAATVDLALLRDAQGTRLRDLTVATATGARLAARGTLASAGSDLAADLALPDLSVLGPGYGGALTGAATFAGTPADGRVTLAGRSADLRVGVAEADGLLRGAGTLDLDLRIAGPQVAVTRAAVATAQVRADIRGTYAPGGSDLAADFALPDAGVLGAAYGGALTGAATFAGTAAAGRVTLTGRSADLRVGVAQVDGLLRGAGTVEADVAFDNGRFTVTRGDVVTAQLQAKMRGSYAPEGSDLRADLALPDAGVLGTGYGGAFRGQASFTGTAQDARLAVSGTGRDLAIGLAEVDGLLRGETALDVAAAVTGARVALDRATLANRQVSAAVTGIYDPAGSDLRATVTLPSLAVLGGGYGGSLQAEARFEGTPAKGRIAVDGSGRNISLSQPEADRILRGDSTLRLRAGLRDRRLQIDEARLRTPQLDASATGTVAETARQLKIDARLVNLGVLLPEFAGPLTVAGTVQDDGRGYDLDLTAQGPGGISARTAGRIDAGFGQGRLTVGGTAQAGLANAFLGERAIDGQVAFDLRLDGPLALASLSGPVRLTGGRLSDPTLPFSLQDLTATATLGGSAARIEAQAGVSSGGTLGVTGNVGLAAPNAGNLQVTLRNVVLRDPQLYQTTVNGTLGVAGPLAGGARISGEILLGETDLRIPSTGLGGAGSLPGLRHVNEPSPVRQTRMRAGLAFGGGDAAAAGGGAAGGGDYGLDIAVIARNRVFIRGRGLDAEIGGRMQIGGSAADIRAAGGFDLVRGRIDIPGKRLTLDRATITLQGDLVPVLDISASNQGDGIVSFVRIAGRADAPEVTFESSPPLPQDEVLAQLLFGQSLDSLSAFQALQLASAVATLAGRGGDGIVGRLRKGFGLDDLDVTSSATGDTTVTAGKYLSRKLYSEVEVQSGGKSRVTLNLDVRRGVTARGAVDNDGNASIGIFVEKDY
jgi:translocation and assembly module TamB